MDAFLRAWLELPRPLRYLRDLKTHAIPAGVAIFHFAQLLFVSRIPKTRCRLKISYNRYGELPKSARVNLMK